MTATVTSGEVRSEQVASSAGAAAAIGPDMQQLRRSYPPRSCPPRWLATQMSTEDVLARVLCAPPPAEDGMKRDTLQRNASGLRRVLGWLFGHPGDTWQARWLASGADSMGNAKWVAAVLASAWPGRGGAGVTVSSGLRVSAQILVSADVIRPSLAWVLTPQAPQNLVPLMARLRDPTGFAELSALCESSGAGRTMKAAALRRAATILVLTVAVDAVDAVMVDSDGVDVAKALSA